MEKHEQLTAILNDLIQIHNDRIKGYEKALSDTGGNSAYEGLFNKMIEQSTGLRQQLTSEVRQIGGEPEWNTTTNTGKLYRTWMDLKTAFTGKTDLSTLELCEFGEDAAQTAYSDAISETADMPEATRTLLINQKIELKDSHDLIKNNRDIEKSRRAEL